LAATAALALLLASPTPDLNLPARTVGKRKAPETEQRLLQDDTCAACVRSFLLRAQIVVGTLLPVCFLFKSTLQPDLYVMPYLCIVLI